MSSELDLRELHRVYEPAPLFVARLRARLEAAANDSLDAASVTALDVEPIADPAEPPRRRWQLLAAAAAVLIAGITAAVSLTGTDDPVTTATESDPTPTPVVDPSLAVFVGEWTTLDADESTPKMTIADAGNATAEMTVLDDAASVCAGAPSTTTGTGEVDSSGHLVIPAPELTCDDGSRPEALSGPPLEDQLRNLTFRSEGSDTLTDSLGSTWRRVGVDAEPTVGGSGQQTSGGMWPQASVEEVRVAQELAEAGDPDYTWQVAPQLTRYENMTVGDPGQVELVDRFLREVLGWEAYLFDREQGGLPDGRTDGALPDQRFHRCAPGRTNPLYRPGRAPEPGELCAPTLDDLHYESVSVDLVQLDREGLDGIWVVNRWSLTAPFAQADPVAVEAQGRERLEEFLAARIAGKGAEGQVLVDFDPDRDVPVLYATTSGARYERYEIERVDGPRWPSAFMTFSGRLFADDDATVVEQVFVWAGGELRMDDVATSENGEPVVLSSTSPDGEFTVSAPSTWNVWLPGNDGGHELAADVWFGGLWRPEESFGSGERIEFVDPVAYDEWCAANGGFPLLSAPAEAAAIAQQVIDDPDFETTAPVAARIGGFDAVSIDVSLAPGGRACGIGMIEISRWIHGLWEPGWRLRLSLVDLPEGMSVETLAITVVAPEGRFAEVIAETAPIIESIEFHPG